MIRASTRRTTNVLVLALYGTIALVVSAIHDPAGCSHPEWKGHPPGKSGPPRGVHRAGDCAACQVLPLGHPPDGRPSCARVEVARSAGSDAPPAVRIADARATANPRAPPRAD
jgi:hypothetical protein